MPGDGDLRHGGIEADVLPLQGRRLIAAEAKASEQDDQVNARPGNLPLRDAESWRLPTTARLRP